MTQSDYTKIKELFEIIRHRMTSMENTQSALLSSNSLMRDQFSVLNGKFDQVQETMNKFQKVQNYHSLEFNDIKLQIKEMKKNLKEIKEAQDKRILPSLIETEKTIKGYGDDYKINNDNVVRLSKRVEMLEDQADINPLVWH